MRVNPPEAMKTTAFERQTFKATQGVYTGRRKLARVFQNRATDHRAAPVTLSLKDAPASRNAACSQIVRATGFPAAP
jgi:hypothetical protein